MALVGEQTQILAASIVDTAGGKFAWAGVGGDRKLKSVSCSVYPQDAHLTFQCSA